MGASQAHVFRMFDGNETFLFKAPGGGLPISLESSPAWTLSTALGRETNFWGTAYVRTHEFTNLLSIPTLAQDGIGTITFSNDTVYITIRTNGVTFVRKLATNPP
jgi:hypothetical protein